MTPKTPLPWYEKDRDIASGKMSIFVTSVAGHALVFEPDDAKFIVHACNNHESLLAACKRVLLHSHPKDDPDFMAVEAAIAKAEGK